MNYLKKLNINFLLVLIIPSLIFGPFLPDLIISLSSLVFLIYLFKKKNFNYFNKKVVIIFFVFCFYCILVSIFFAKNKIFSFESSLFYFRIGIFACLIWYLIEQGKKILSYFYYTLLICFSFLALDGYFQFFFGFNIIGLPILSNRISSFFGNELIMGSYLSRLFPLLFALFLLKKKSSKFEVYYIGVLFILIDVLIYIAGERASFFFLNLSTLFIIFFIKKYQTFRLLTFICSLILIAGLTFAYDKFYNRMIFDTAKGMGFLEESQKKNIFTKGHESLIKTAYNMFLDKPIFGHGPKMFRVICKDEKYAIGISPCDNHPHNFYIQLLAETGIIGFSFLFSVFAYILYCAYRQFKSIVLRQKRYLNDYQVCLLAGILITVWPFTTNGNFFHNWLMIVYSLPVGFYLHSIYGKNRGNISF
jgi:O-antigen ligase